MMPEKNDFPTDAVEVLAQVHDPHFFQKLAQDWNIIPRSDEERAQLLELGAILRGVQNEQTKTASASGNSFLQGALDSLKSTLQDQGYATNPTSNVLAIKHAASEIAKNDAVAEAAFKYATYLFDKAEK